MPGPGRTGNADGRTRPQILTSSRPTFHLVGTVRAGGRGGQQHRRRWEGPPPEGKGHHPAAGGGVFDQGRLSFASVLCARAGEAAPGVRSDHQRLPRRTPNYQRTSYNVWFHVPAPSEALCPHPGSRRNRRRDPSLKAAKTFKINALCAEFKNGRRTGEGRSATGTRHQAQAKAKARQTLIRDRENRDKDETVPPGAGGRQQHIFRPSPSAADELRGFPTNAVTASTILT